MENENVINERKNPGTERTVKNSSSQKMLCPKCEGANPISNERCQFCGYKFGSSVKYSQPDIKRPESTKITVQPENTKNYILHYIYSFLIPIVAFILGSILMSKDDEDDCKAGKICVLLGIVSCAIIAVVCLTVFSF